MQPGMPQYHFEPHFAPTPHFSPYSGSPIAPHANQFHAPAVPHLPNALIKHQAGYGHTTPILPNQTAAPAASHQQPGNMYAPDATVTNITNHETLHAGQKLKIGDVVEVSRGGHTELAYVNSNNQLKQINNATINNVPSELRSHIQKIGGPAYFAREVHNRIATSGLMGQFKASDNRGPNKPLI
jgi:hypothetical protein